MFSSFESQKIVRKALCIQRLKGKKYNVNENQIYTFSDIRNDRKLFYVNFTALDAMRNAYEEDLEEEKEKYRVALKTMFTDDYVEEIKKRHE